MTEPVDPGSNLFTYIIPTPRIEVVGFGVYISITVPEMYDVVLAACPLSLVSRYGKAGPVRKFVCSRRSRGIFNIKPSIDSVLVHRTVHWFLSVYRLLFCLVSGFVDWISAGFIREIPISKVYLSTDVFSRTCLCLVRDSYWFVMIEYILLVVNISPAFDDTATSRYGPIFFSHLSALLDIHCPLPCHSGHSERNFSGCKECVQD